MDNFESKEFTGRYNGGNEPRQEEERVPADVRIRFRRDDELVRMQTGFYSSTYKYMYGRSRGPGDVGLDEWIFRLDFLVAPEPGDYPIPATGIMGGLLIQGGMAFVRGGRLTEGTINIKEIDLENNIVTGSLSNVKAQGGRPDGSEMPSAFAELIQFVCPL